MSPPLLGVGEEGRSNVSLVVTAPSIDRISPNGLGLKERNYLGLSDCSSVDGPAVLSSSEDRKINLNLKATELRLGIPGSQSPERETDLCFMSPRKFDEKPLFPLVPSKDGFSGNKRGFSDTVDGFSGMKSSIFSEKWMFNVSGSDCKSQQSAAPVKLSCHSGLNVTVVTKEMPPKGTLERPCTTNGQGPNETGASNNCNRGPVAKAQVVGWPPIRSFRKNTLSTNSKNNDEVDGKPGPGALFVKVSMDGAPYLRKVDLRTYSTYQELSSALEKMFGCFIVVQCGSQGAPGREMLAESKIRDLLHGTEYVLSYEDKDEDWMLVGDVPWEMFIDSCKRLKIMKSSDAIGLAPRAMEKLKNQS